MGRTVYTPSHPRTPRRHPDSAGAALRFFVIALTAFLTVVDLFATQAILPSLTKHYRRNPGTDGLCRMRLPARLLSPFGPGRRLFRSGRSIGRKGILISLIVLAIPTALLAHAPDLTTLASCREYRKDCAWRRPSRSRSPISASVTAPPIQAGAFAAYITGNVAQPHRAPDLSAGVTDHFGLAASSISSPHAQSAGTALVYFTVEKTKPMHDMGTGMSSHFGCVDHALKNPSLRASFAIGFCILFAFIGTFTFVNFVLVQPPLGVSAMTLAGVYFVFVPRDGNHAAGRSRREALRHQATFWAALAVHGLRLPLLRPAELAGGAGRHGAGRGGHLLRPGLRHGLCRSRRDL